MRANEGGENEDIADRLRQRAGAFRGRRHGAGGDAAARPSTPTATARWTRAEFDAYLTASFTAIDANGDGYVTEAESAGTIPADLYASANANGDDGISLQEFQAQAQADFAAADENGDGMLK